MSTGIPFKDLAAWSVDGFLAGQPQGLAEWPQDRLGLRKLISEFLHGPVREQATSHGGPPGVADGSAELHALAYACHAAIALRDRNLLNQDDQNQLYLATILIEHLYAAAPFFEARLRRKVAMSVRSWKMTKGGRLDA